MDWNQIFEKAICNQFDADEIKNYSTKYSQLWNEKFVFYIWKYISEHSLTNEQIIQLKQSCIECEEFYLENQKRRNYHFGYPANLLNPEPIYYIFAEYEKQHFLANNCGDTFEQGNYSMDSKKIEQSILAMFAEKFGIEKYPYWGYITSGGSESNAWGINSGYQMYPDGILYYCESAHYSVRKNIQGRRSICIPQRNSLDESIDCDLLLKMIRTNLQPAILFLTWPCVLE